ncbi:TSC22 domain family protein 4 [Tachyglossus aculeatus]|uniref:TSC22 domain family protein 4 n=1 Tax=Tachyglossus aculeatus TaxID=9261 RepID=UPI0018F66377|nr:TSC22 domain family protein 4 [Tachyglossus aculeatus]XP_038624797.1 TSC22 domain family protein 4 [Tachyglossus aculeatus]
MSGGKKKSSFQITSVTTDYDVPLAGVSPGTPAPRFPDGEPTQQQQQQQQQPPGTQASRFRVVKLPQGLGEPYRRGRWTCLDVYERDLEPPGLGRLLDGARGPGAGGRSLDSRLELAGLALGTPAPAPLPGPQSAPRLRSPTPGPQARSFTGGLAQLAAGPGRAQTPPPGPGPPPHLHHPHHPHQPPPPPEGQWDPGAGEGTGPSPRASTPVPALRLDADGGTPASTPPTSRRKDGTTWPRKDAEDRGMLPLGGSRPSSPALSLLREGSPARKTPDPFGVAAQRLGLFVIGGSVDSDDDSGSGSMVAIDNKIEQAMDLVKSHLMFAVREEVEVLKEQIRELAERNAALEQENGLLRALASPDQLAQLPQPAPRPPGPPAPNGPSS